MTVAIAPELVGAADAARRTGDPVTGEAPGRRLGDVVRRGAGFAAVVALWEIAARTVLSGRNVIAAPSAIVATIVDQRELLTRAAGVTSWEAARGFALGNAAALVAALLVAIVPLTEGVVLRLALVVYCLPLVALGPVLRVILGPGEGPQVVLAALAVFFTTLVPTVVGLRAVPQSWLDLVTSYGRGRVRAAVSVRSRAAVPYLFAGLQVAAPAALLGAIVGEFTGAERGLGLLSINFLRGLRTDELWAVATVAAAIALGGYFVLGAIGRRVAGYPPAVLLRAATPARPVPAWQRAARSGIETVAIVGVVLAGWIGLTAGLGLSPFFAKRPAEVWAYLFTDPAAAANRRELITATWQTLRIAVPGYLLGLAVGVGGACAFELSAALRRALNPFAVALRCVPIVVVAPLLVHAFGRGPAGTAVTVAILTFFPTLVSCAAGLRQTPGQVRDVFASYGTSRLRTLLHAQVPGMAPAFFAAARMAVPATVLAATVAEWLAAGTGTGNLMAVAAATSRYSTLWSTVVVVMVLAVLWYGLIAAIGRATLAAVAPEQVTGR